LLSYAPPVEVIRAIQAAGKIRTEQDLKVFVNIGAGIIRWALNDKSVMESGVRWVYSVFHIEERIPHYFFRYEIHGERVAKFTILEQDISKFKTVTPGKAYEDIRRCMTWLRDQGVMPDTNITQDQVNTALYFFREYVYDDKVVFENKRVTDIYRGIPVAENSGIGSAIRVIGPTRSDYKSGEVLNVFAPATIKCLYCGEHVPCCKDATESICRSCKDDAEGASHISCEHVECSRYGCMHYSGNIDQQDDSPTPDYYDRMFERGY